MSAGLLPYTEYRPADLPWVDCIPAHWETSSLKQLASIQLSNVDKLSEEDEQPVLLCNYIDVYKHDSIRSGLPFMAATAKSSEIDRFQLLRGDVLITKDSEMWDDIGVPAIVAEELRGVLCGYHLAMLRPSEGLLDGWYLYWALESRPTALQFHVAATGVTRFGISKADIKDILIPRPPVPEQASIALFLSHAQRQITRLVRSKRRLIALLNEEKQAIIQQAVTRGLNPDVPLRDSGLDWIGPIPAHWDVKRNGALFEIRKQPGDPTNPILEVSLHTGVTVRDLGDLKRKQMMSDLTQYQAAHSGDIAYNMMRMWQGAAGVVPVDGLVSPAYVVLKPRSGTDSRYFAFLYRTQPYMREMDCYSRGIVKDRNRLYWADYKQMPAIVPPYNEQVTIVDWLTNQLEALNSIVERTNREIDLIREYRTRLIADIVTGQLDVREAAASLPEIEAEDTKTLLAEADEVADDIELMDEDVDLDESADAAD